MYKLIAIIVAAIPFILLLRSLFFGRSKRTSRAVSEFKKNIDYLVWAILFFIGCAMVYAIGKLIYPIFN
jgi:hypothetical protein